MPDSLTLAHFSDREFMHILSDFGDWVTSEQIARSVGLTSKNPNSNVGSRCAWLHRYGLIERKQKGTDTLWKLSTIGETLVSSDKVPNKISALSETERIAVLDTIAKGLPRGKRAVAHFGRRTFTHYMGTYRDPKLFRQ